jgi:hypothetical protein
MAYELDVDHDTLEKKMSRDVVMRKEEFDLPLD